LEFGREDPVASAFDDESLGRMLGMDLLLSLQKEQFLSELSQLPKTLDQWGDPLDPKKPDDRDVEYLRQDEKLID
jgi:hypothetical protein